MTTIVSGMPIVSSTQVVVDDRNPLISYGGPWGLGGVASEYNSTTHGVTSPATVHLSFQGTSIAAYGTHEGNAVGCQVTYTLDGVAMSTGVPPAISLPAGNNMYGVQFFVSPQLPAAIHTLNITIGPCNSNNTAIYWLDYFVFQPIAKSTS